MQQLPHGALQLSAPLSTLNNNASRDQDSSFVSLQLPFRPLASKGKPARTSQHKLKTRLQLLKPNTACRDGDNKIYSLQLPFRPPPPKMESHQGIPQGMPPPGMPPPGMPPPGMVPPPPMQYAPRGPMMAFPPPVSSSRVLSVRIFVYFL